MRQIGINDNLAVDPHVVSVEPIVGHKMVMLTTRSKLLMASIR
jgi:hypothetical protein